MQNIILLFIYLLLIAVNHFRYKFLLSGNAGEMILYFANVFFNPLALSFIIATIICITIKINILRHSRRFFKCAYKALLPAAP